jgi:hypothetical protein
VTARPFNNLLIAWLVPAVLGLAAGEPPETPPAQAGDTNDRATPPAKPAPAAGYRAGKTERVPFLGLMTVQANPQQRKQASVPEGFGLNVLYVVRESPAQAAGVRPTDMLYKFQDQLLVNEPQLRVLVRGSKPGQTVELTLVRGGKPLVVKVQLVEKDVAVMEGTPDNMMLWRLGPAQASPASSRPGFSARWDDDSHLLEIKTDAQGKSLVAKDKTGAVLFEGPINTPEQRKAIPAAILPKVERLENPPPPKVAPTPSPPSQAPKPDLS